MRHALTIMSAGVEPIMVGAVPRCTTRHRVRSLAEVRAVLDTVAPLPERGYLDLVGHSTRDAHLLRMGDAVIDMSVPSVERFFTALRRDGVLARARIGAVRLLGCETAVSLAGQRTMRLLARALGVPVYGAWKVLLKSHYDADGFVPAFVHVLIESAELPRPVFEASA